MKWGSYHASYSDACRFSGSLNCGCYRLIHEGAVRNARNKGFDVHLGQLSAQAFDDESFDAVVMGHVIEHVPAPGELLGECRRILNKEGILVALTQNADSSMHIHYGPHWRGLETPRHLQIFTPESLENLAKNTGYDVIEVFTTMNGFVCQDLASRQLVVGEKHIMGGYVQTDRRILSHIKALGYGWAHIFWPGVAGEEVVLVCRK